MVKVVDDDIDTVWVMVDGYTVRSWSYASGEERRLKMTFAREFTEGWVQAWKRRPV